MGEVARAPCSLFSSSKNNQNEVFQRGTHYFGGGLARKSRTHFIQGEKSLVRGQERRRVHSHQHLTVRAKYKVTFCVREVNAPRQSHQIIGRVQFISQKPTSAPHRENRSRCPEMSRQILSKWDYNGASRCAVRLAFREELRPHTFEW